MYIICRLYKDVIHGKQIKANKFPHDSLAEEQEVKEGIVNAFQHQLLEEPGWRAGIEGLHLQRLNHSEAEALEMPFTEEEIFLTLMEMNGDNFICFLFQFYFLILLKTFS